MPSKNKWIALAGILSIILIGLIVYLVMYKVNPNENKPILDDEQKITFAEHSINNDMIKTDKPIQTNVIEVKELDGLEVIYDGKQVTVEDMEYQKYDKLSIAVLHEDKTFWYTPNSLAFEYAGRIRLAIQTDKPIEIKILRK